MLIQILQISKFCCLLNKDFQSIFVRLVSVKFWSVHNSQCFKKIYYAYEIQMGVDGYLCQNVEYCCMAVYVILSRFSMIPLMYAARQGHIKVVESLLPLTSDVNCQDNKGFTVCYVLYAEVNIRSVVESFSEYR